jgi:Leucine-rich repeat (LRR) protein
MKNIILIFCVFILLFSCNENSTNPSDCSILKKNQLSNCDTALMIIDADVGTIPDCIGDLSKLRGIYLMNNNITEIPDALFKLSNLTSIFFEENNISKLPNKFDKLTQLKQPSKWNCSN